MHTGQQLIEQGWRQGSLLSARSARFPWLIPGDEGPLLLTADDLPADERLVIISNDCDISAPLEKERLVEALRAHWTTDKTEVHNARRNSVRRFLLRRRTIDGGNVEGLIADATTRVQIDKSVLLASDPERAFEVGDIMTPRYFRRWLAARYDRPAVEDRIVLAVHKPIVKAIEKLKDTDPIHRTLDGIREIRYRLRTDQAPYQVEMLLMREEDETGAAVREEEASNLAGWLADKLDDGGEALLVNWDIFDIWTISVGDYQNTVDLPLAHYSLADSTVAAGGAGSAQP